MGVVIEINSAFTFAWKAIILEEFNGVATVDHHRADVVISLVASFHLIPSVWANRVIIWSSNHVAWTVLAVFISEFGDTSKHGLIKRIENHPLSFVVVAHLSILNVTGAALPVLSIAVPIIIVKAAIVSRVHSVGLGCGVTHLWNNKGGSYQVWELMDQIGKLLLGAAHSDKGWYE